MAKKQGLVKVGSETITNNFIDSETGEILDTETLIKERKLFFTNGERFAIAFSSLTGVLDGLEKAEIKIIIWCSQNCALNSNKINLGSGYRALICSEINIKEQSLKNAISSLAKKGVLIKEGGAMYMIHPKYFWRGDLGARRKFIVEMNLDMTDLKPKEKNKITPNTDFEKVEFNKTVTRKSKKNEPKI